MNVTENVERQALDEPGDLLLQVFHFLGVVKLANHVPAVAFENLVGELLALV